MGSVYRLARMEKQLIHWLASYIGRVEDCPIGIGDDAAVLRSDPRQTVFCTDAICDGVHFRSDLHSPEEIGRKALAVNLSDMAAMGAAPRAAVVSLVLPDTSTLDYVKRLFHGMRPLAESYDVHICGGDTTVWPGKLSITVALVGVAPAAGVWRIDTAQAGDTIVVTGEFGGSILGHHLDFEPRCRVAQHWVEQDVIHAATDVSDSLSLDLHKMATASGLGFEIRAEQIPIAPAANELANRSAGSGARQLAPLEHALCDGEDFELILAVDPGDAHQLIRPSPAYGAKLTVIGKFTATRDYVLIKDNRQTELPATGFRHQFK